MKPYYLNITAFLYKNLLKPVLFLVDAELVHETFLSMGEFLGNNKTPRSLFKSLYKVSSPSLSQKIVNINFKNPIGLAAGFDYEAKLFKILPVISFGFETIGTITNHPYEGNPKPRLGRLPESKSLLVNKGFKNSGIENICQKIQNQKFEIPVGLSIGKTNGKKITTQEEAIVDITTAFKIAEKVNLNTAYYELNISCPNLIGNVEFYSSKHLEDLLTAVDKLKIKKPIFIKMPISKTNPQVKKMLDIIINHKITGIIFGNLETDKKNNYILKDEVRKYKKGNFSGLPTQKRSDELIKFAYKHYKNKLIIIGCGGIFNVQDAYRKIKLGASLVQLITGMIFEGPQLISQINNDLIILLKNDGFKNIKEAIGADNN